MALCQHMRKLADCFSCRRGLWLGEQLEAKRKADREILGQRLLSRCTHVLLGIKGTKSEKVAKLAKALFKVEGDRLKGAWEVLHPGMTWIEGFQRRRAPIIIAYYVVYGRIP